MKITRNTIVNNIFNKALRAIAQNAAHPSRNQDLMPMLFRIAWTA